MEQLWVAIDVEGTKMKEINLPFLYQLGWQLHTLAGFTYKPENRAQLVMASFNTQRSIERLLVDFPALEVCRTRGEQLVKNIKWIDEWFDNLVSETDEEKRKQEWFEADPSLDYRFQHVIDTAKEFETVLLADMERLLAYYPGQKGNYSTRQLIERAENALPQSALNKISSDARREITESGRCFVFDTPTACGFHIMRATEAVMHEFYLQVCKPQPEPNERLESWAEYIKRFRQSSDPYAKQVAELLQQIKDLNRNPIMHPEVFLNDDQAFKLFELAKSAIIVMAGKLTPNIVLAP
jgi:hypothetical protein